MVEICRVESAGPALNVRIFQIRQGLAERVMTTPRSSYKSLYVIGKPIEVANPVARKKCPVKLGMQVVWNSPSWVHVNRSSFDESGIHSGCHS